MKESEEVTCICPDHCKTYASNGEQGGHAGRCESWCEGVAHCDWCQDPDKVATHEGYRDRDGFPRSYTYACVSCRDRLSASGYEWEPLDEITSS